MTNDQSTSKKHRLSAPSIGIGLMIGSLGTLIGLAAFDRFSDRLEQLPGVAAPTISKEAFGDSKEATDKAALELTTNNAAALTIPTDHATDNIAFDCRQTFASRSGNAEYLTLSFNSDDQTLTLGAITGLPFERINQRLHFSYAPGYLAEDQFTDDYIFEPTSGRLSQRVRVPSMPSAGVQLADGGGYATIYTAKYRCTRARLRQ